MSAPSFTRRCREALKPITRRSAAPVETENPAARILMHSYADRYTHDFFFERDYPDVKVSGSDLCEAAPGAELKAPLQKRAGSMDVFEKALEKLWIHGGAVVDSRTT